MMTFLNLEHSKEMSCYCLLLTVMLLKSGLDVVQQTWLSVTLHAVGWWGLGLGPIILQNGIVGLIELKLGLAEWDSLLSRHA